MELRNINTFLHVAELHSFSRAARELDYSQSAVSSQIAQLEEELAVPLFDRVGKTVRLTDAGQTFLRYARTLLTTAQQAKAALQPAPEASGTLRVAIADSLSTGPTWPIPSTSRSPTRPLSGCWTNRNPAASSRRRATRWPGGRG